MSLSSLDSVVEVFGLVHDFLGDEEFVSSNLKSLRICSTSFQSVDCLTVHGHWSGGVSDNFLATGLLKNFFST